MQIEHRPMLPLMAFVGKDVSAALNEAAARVSEQWGPQVGGPAHRTRGRQRLRAAPRLRPRRPVWRHRSTPGRTAPGPSVYRAVHCKARARFFRRTLRRFRAPVRLATAAVKEAAMKVLRFLLGLAIGAGVALLFAPKSGRELRQQLAGGRSGKLLGAGPDDYPQPEPAAWGGPATAVAEPPPSWTVPAVPLEPHVGRTSRSWTRSSSTRSSRSRPVARAGPAGREGAGERRPARAHRRDARGAGERAGAAVRGPTRQSARTRRR